MIILFIPSPSSVLIKSGTIIKIFEFHKGKIFIENIYDRIVEIICCFKLIYLGDTIGKENIFKIPLDTCIVKAVYLGFIKHYVTNISTNINVKIEKTAVISETYTVTKIGSIVERALNYLNIELKMGEFVVIPGCKVTNVIFRGQNVFQLKPELTV